MNELEHKILVHIRNHHRGSENAITFNALSVELQINSRQLRECVSNIVTNGEGCIGTDSVSGYYYAINDEEFTHCYRELISRGLKDFKRARGLMRARTNDKQEVREVKQLQLI